MNDMDAFTELVKKSPDVELMNFDDLHAMVFWSGAAMKWAKTQIDIAQEIEGMQGQINAWTEEGQAAADLQFKARARRGELAKKEAKANSKFDPERSVGGGQLSQGGRVASGEPPKWQRLGYKSEQEMRGDEFLHSNPEIIEEVQKQAKEASDFPSLTAAKNLKRAKKAEAANKAYKEGKAEDKAAAQAVVAKGEAAKYLSKLREVVLILPVKIPPEGWTESSFAEARGMVDIIKSRLEAWNE